MRNRRSGSSPFSMSQLIFFCFTFMLLTSSATDAADPGSLLQDTALKAQAKEESPEVSQLREGARLEITGRSGSWYQVRSSAKVGWVPLFRVRLEPAPIGTPSARPAQLRRIRSHTIVMGVRGLDTLDFEKSEADYRALDSLDRYAATDAEVEDFGSQGGARLIPVDSGSILKLREKDETDERAAGREIAGTILGNVALVEDEALQRYVNRVGRWVALRSDRPGLAWRFGVLDSEAINAFAVPGGWVFITLGLIRGISSESELAGVLGHEIAHIVSRDHYRLLQILGAVKKIGGALQKSPKGSDALKHASAKMFGNATRVLTMALDQQTELDADRMGTLLATDSGYEPFGLARALQLIEREKSDGPRIALLSKTHPTPRKRLQSLETCAQGRILARAASPDRAQQWRRLRAKHGPSAR